MLSNFLVLVKATVLLKLLQSVSSFFFLFILNALNMLIV